LRREFLANKNIDQAELEFLLEARKEARSVAPSFQHFLFEAVRTWILADGKITPQETAWLEQWFLADRKVDEPEKKLLKELRLLADQTCPEFQALCKKHLG
jgi:hypothetical protein